MSQVKLKQQHVSHSVQRPTASISCFIFVIHTSLATHLVEPEVVQVRSPSVPSILAPSDIYESPFSVSPLSHLWIFQISWPDPSSATNQASIISKMSVGEEQQQQQQQKQTANHNKRKGKKNEERHKWSKAEMKWQLKEEKKKKKKENECVMNFNGDSCNLQFFIFSQDTNTSTTIQPVCNTMCSLYTHLHTAYMIQNTKTRLKQELVCRSVKEMVINLRNRDDHCFIHKFDIFIFVQRIYYYIYQKKVWNQKDFD